MYFITGVGDYQQFNGYFYIFIGTFIGVCVIMDRTHYTGRNNNASKKQDGKSTTQLINCASRYLLDKQPEKLGLSTNEILPVSNAF